MVQQSSDDSTVPEAEQRGVRLGGGAIASLTGVGALVIFMVQNTDDVTVKFLVWDFTWPVWLLTLVAALLGAIVWLGLGMLRRHRRRKERRADRRD
ncbi:MAG: lipopolysaccharide assembly protein LapA domain-containing protein [Acidimicrobiales bacterium]